MTKSSPAVNRDTLPCRMGRPGRDGVAGERGFSKMTSSFRDSRENLIGFGRKKRLAHVVRGGGLLMGTKMRMGQGMMGEEEGVEGLELGVSAGLLDLAEVEPELKLEMELDEEVDVCRLAIPRGLWRGVEGVLLEFELDDAVLTLTLRLG